MKLRNVLIAVFIILLIVLAVATVLFLMRPAKVQTGGVSSSFVAVEPGSAGDNGYVVFNYRGNGNVTAISLDKKPELNVTIIDDTQAIQATKFDSLVTQLKTLEDYGYSVKVANDSKVGKGIYIVPTGAMPVYVLYSLQQGTNATIIYIGKKDLLLSNGIKQNSWYQTLTPEQKSHIIVYDGPLDDFLDNDNVSLSDEILNNSWMLKNSSYMALAGSGLKTISLPIGQQSYVRLIYHFSDVDGLYDSPLLVATPLSLNADPQSIYPWQSSELQFSLNKTNGTAFISVRKDGKIIDQSQLMRVTDSNVFFKRLSYTEPGVYELIVEDNSGTIGGGILHIKDLNISLKQRYGLTYVFSVNVDGQPLSNAEVMVSLGDSKTKKKYYVSDGEMAVTAKLNQGMNTFNVNLEDSVIPVNYNNSQEGIFDFYLKYGIPALAFVFVVYFGARMSKRPTYNIRFGEAATYIRQEIKLPRERALESFSRIRNDLKLSGSPITPHEFTISLKRYLTNGADVTEGNVEEILKHLVSVGELESHRDLYQLKGEGNIRRNALKRMIREKLIEAGVQFKETGDKFVAADYEIGFFGTAFARKGIVVVDDKAEVDSILAKMGENEKAKLRLMQANDRIMFVTIDRLSEVL